MNIIPWDGLPITEPGVYSGIPIDIYHSAAIMPAGVKCVSSSGLRTAVLDSAAHFWDESVYNPEREERETSEPMILGRAAHHLLLGEDDFRRSFVVRPETYPGAKGDAKWTMAADYCKRWVATQTDAGLTVLTEGQIDRIRGMAQSMQRDPLIRAGALSGYIEHSFFWRDEETGLWLKWRPDALPEGSLDFCDLKCVADVTFDAVQRSIADYGYNMQGALGRWACRAVLGREMNSFTLISVESKRPHCVAPYEVESSGGFYPGGAPKESAMDLGERQLRLGLKLIARGFDTGSWPGPGGTVSDARAVGLADWAQRRAEIRLAEIEQELAA